MENVDLDRKILLSLDGNGSGGVGNPGVPGASPEEIERALKDLERNGLVNRPRGGCQLTTSGEELLMVARDDAGWNRLKLRAEHTEDGVTLANIVVAAWKRMGRNPRQGPPCGE